MVPLGSSVMLELVLAVHSYHVIAYLVVTKKKLPRDHITDETLLSLRQRINILINIEGVRKHSLSRTKRGLAAGLEPGQVIPPLQVSRVG